MHDSRDALRLTRALFPELAAEIDAARSRNGSESPADGGEALDAWIDRRAEELRASGGAGSALDALEALDGGAARERLVAAFAAAREAFAPAGLSVPEPEAFADAGVDLDALGELLAADPELVPVPAPHGLGAETWLALFRAAAARAAASGAGALATGSHAPTASQGARDERTEGAEALVLASEVGRDFAELDRVADPSAPVLGAAPAWTLRLIPAGPRPEVLGLSFAHGPHPSLPEILTLQLMRIVRGEDPLDAESFTWVAGLLAGGRLAARHVYDAGESVVRITAREPGNQGPHLGARRPRG